MSKYDLSFISVLIAIEGALLTVVVAVLNQINAGWSRRLAKKQYIDTYAERVRQWGCDVVEEFDSAVCLCDLDPAKLPEGDMFARRLQCLAHFSSLADKGRWFFMNVSRDQYGGHKEAAFRGFRPRVLDAIIDGRRELLRLDYHSAGENHGIKQSLVAQKKIFVSEVQDFLNPEAQMRDRQRL